MAYEKTTWIDHVEDPITGEVYTQGTPVDAAHLNKMEQSIADAIPASEKGAANGVVSTNSNNKATPEQTSKLKVSVSASKILGLTDAGTHQYVFGSTEDNVITIPLSSSVFFPIDTEIEVYRASLLNSVSIVPQPGVTLYAKSGVVTSFDVPFRGYALLKKIASDGWIILNSVPIAHKHPVTDLSDVVRSKTLYSPGSYYDVAIPLFPIIQTTDNVDHYFRGTVFFRRYNANAAPQMLQIEAQTVYDTDDVRYAFESYGTQTENLSVYLGVFTYNNVKYFGLCLHANSSTFEHLYIEGYCSDWDVIQYIRYYNNQTSTAVNQEINDSIHFSGEDMIEQYISFPIAPYVRANGSPTLQKIWYEGNDGAGSTLDAGLLAGKQPYEYMQYIGGLDTQSNLLEWIDSLPVGTIGSFSLSSSITTEGVPVVSSFDGIILRNNAAAYKQVMLTERNSGQRIFLITKSTTWGDWVNAADGGNAATLQGLAAAAFALASHTHAASQVTAGALAGQVLANATAQATLGTAQVRNIYAGTGAMTAGSTALATGHIYLQYE